MSDLSKKISIISLIGGSSFLIYLLLKKYISPFDEKSSEITLDDDVRLQIAPNMPTTLTELIKLKKEAELGDKIIGSFTETKKDVESTEKPVKKNIKNIKIDDGVIIGNYFIRASKDKKGNLVVGKLGGKKSVYSVFGKLFLPFKLKEVYEGSIKIKDVDFYYPNENEVLSIKLIDNDNKTFYVNKVELDNIIDRFKTNTKGHKLIVDKGEFKLTKI
jgi:hypothetical protein